MKNLWNKIKSDWKRMPKFMRVLCITLLLTSVFMAHEIFTGPRELSDEEKARQLFDTYVDTAKEITYNEFRSMAYRGEVDTLWYKTDNEKMVFTLYTEETSGKEKEEIDPYAYPESNYYITQYPSGDAFRSTMISYNINLILVRNETETTASIIISIIGALAGPVVMILVLRMLMKTQTANDIKADDVLQKSNVNMDDIIGLDEIKGELNLVVNLIKDPEYGKAMGVRLPKGILLSGPAGVGKTMIAKAISKEADVPFMSVNGSDFQELYVGNGARHVRQVFRIARQNAPCIVFIDEFDSIGERRDSRRSDSEDNKTINAILKEMDGFKELSGVFVLAATNHPEKLDPAIIRPGRFDREIIIPPPRNWKTRSDMIAMYLKDEPLSDDVDFESLAKSIPGFTGADIATMCNEAGIVALSLGRSCIDTYCIEQAIDRKVFKGTKSKQLLSFRDRQIVAYHEASHVVISLINKVPVSRVSIVSTTSGVGGAVFNKDKESQFRTATDFQIDIMVCYAGRAGEYLKFGDVTTGASNDIQQATDQIYDYVCTYGFSNGSPKLNQKMLAERGIDLSDTYQHHIDGLAQSLWERTVNQVKDNFELIEKLAEHLLEVSMMSGKEVEIFLGISTD